MQDVYKNIEEYSPGRKYNVLIVFNDMIVDLISNKKLNQVVTGLFIRDQKLNITIAFIRQTYFSVPKYVILNGTHFLL